MLNYKFVIVNNIISSLLYCDQYLNLFFVNLCFLNLPSHINFNGTEWLVSTEVPSRNHSLTQSYIHSLTRSLTHSHTQ